MKTIGVSEAKILARSILERFRLSPKDAELTASHLVAAETRGYPGHGLRRLLGIAAISERIGQHGSNRISIDKHGFMLFDAQHRLGIPSVEDAITELANRLNQEAAIAFGVKGYVGTTGSLGIYCSRLAQQGIVSILMCNSQFAVAPHGSRRAVLGTNPIAFGFPGSPTSFCADVATAAWSYGAIRDLATAGGTLPLGVVQTADGKPSTDPNDADNGSQLPAAGHKGYALGLAIELLCGPLIGAKAGRHAVSGTEGFFGMLIRTDAAHSAEASNADAQALFSEIRSGPPIDPCNRIRIPGESAQSTELTSKQIEVPQEIFDKLQAL